MKITLLNTGILTSFGLFDFKPLTRSEAVELVRDAEIVSAVGHAATAGILSDLLNIEVQANRFEYIQKVGDTALVFKLKSRIPEGKVLNREEIEKIGYEFGLLRRIK